MNFARPHLTPLLVLLLAAASFAVPTVSAAALLLTDKEGDVLVTNGQASAPAPLPANAQTASTDLKELDVDEEDTDFTFTLKPASFAQQGGSINSYTTTFTWMDANFRVDAFRSHIDPSSRPLTRATLGLCATPEKCTRVTDLEHKLDEAGGTFSFLVPKRYITSLQGHAPVFGSQLTGVTVHSVTSFDGFPGAPATNTRAEDLMPDTGAGVITFQKGGTANGHIVLEAPDPVRVSNGGATTFVFNCHVQNALDVEDTATFSLDGVPSTWTVTTPGPQKIPPKSEKPVFVLATIPFGHEHGGFSNFTLIATSTKDPTVKAELRFGVLHTPTPMPAGHHSEVYLHAAPADSGVFQTALPRTDVSMSAKEDHANDAPDALASVGQQGEVSWRIPLAPQLQIGVDMDLNRTGNLVASVSGHADAQATLSGELWLVKGDEDIAMLGKLADAKLALTQNGPTMLKSMFTPDPKGDYVPYAPGNNMELRLKLKVDGATPTNPQSPPSLGVKDFKLSLPLNEYADAPSFEEGEGTTIKINAPDGLEKTGRPGTTITYEFGVTNLNTGPGEYAIELAGTDAKHSESAPIGALRLDAKETKTVTLAVHIPGDAQSEQRLESILVIRSKTDPSDLTLARTATLVMKGSAAADEQAKFDAAKNAGKKTPVPPMGALVALALSAALFTARRARR